MMRVRRMTKMRMLRAGLRHECRGDARFAVESQRYISWIVAVTIIAVLALAATSHAAAVVREEAVQADGDAPGEPMPVPESEMSERIIVDPEPNWGDWSDIDDSFYHYSPGGLRIDTWVDRGEWATYEPGERLWVYFRVNRPCYVTILDYTTDGRVETIYPNPWSGSSVVYPGRAYRVPDDRRFSLRIAGPGGIETLVACAHELSWPSGPSGWWVPQYHPWIEHRGRVVPGGSPGGYVVPGGSSGGHVVPGGSPGGYVVPGGSSGGHVVPGGSPGGYVVPGGSSGGRVVAGGGSSGRVAAGGSSRRSPRDRRPSGWRGQPRGRVVVGPGWWPVPDGWRDAPGRWACDSVTFRVVDGDGSDWGQDWWHGGDSWDDDDGWEGGSYGQEYGGRPLMHERFQLGSPKDSMHETFRFDGEKVHVTIDCIASRKDDPTEIIGRIGWDGGWGGETIFRLDVTGREGDVPRRGVTYTAFSGPVRVDVEIVDFRVASVRPWQLPRIEWIKFDVKAYGA